MGPSLSQQQLAGTRHALLGAGSTELIDLVFRLNTRQSVESSAAAASRETAIELGWLAHDGHSFTPLGWLVADSIREYHFWLDRNRRCHSENRCALLAPESYADKSVLEVGSGFGCNLLSLMCRVRGRFVGLDPVDVYRQLSPIFAEREGLPVPEVVDGRGEAIPFPDREFDIVLCNSAHQYMDVRPALHEMARVIRPGGQLQIIGGTFESFSSGYGRRVLRERRLGTLKHYLVTMTNTAAYECLGCRLLAPGGNGATGTPIYPRRRSMRRWIADTGLSLREDMVGSIGILTCFFADKPALASCDRRC